MTERDNPTPQELRRLIETARQQQASMGKQLSSWPESNLKGLYQQLGYEETPEWAQLSDGERLYLKSLRAPLIHAIDQKAHPEIYEPEDTFFDFEE